MVYLSDVDRTEEPVRIPGVIVSKGNKRRSRIVREKERAILVIFAK